MTHSIEELTKQLNAANSRALEAKRKAGNIRKQLEAAVIAKETSRLEAMGIIIGETVVDVFDAGYRGGERFRGRFGVLCVDASWGDHSRIKLSKLKNDGTVGMRHGGLVWSQTRIAKSETQPEKGQAK